MLAKQRLADTSQTYPSLSTLRPCCLYLVHWFSTLYACVQISCWRRGRKWVWSWSLTLRPSVTSASSRFTSSWWARERNRTSVAWVIPSQPADKTHTHTSHAAAAFPNHCINNQRYFIYTHILYKRLIMYAKINTYLRSDLSSWFFFIH